MALFTFEDIYVINFTDITKGTISIPVNSFIDNIVDIILVGKSKLEYGDEFDENILHLLENFATFQDNDSITIKPDIAQASAPALRLPTQGEFWFNKSDNRLYAFDGTNWNLVKLQSDVQGNKGIIVNGQQIPLPSGFDNYSECSWFVSPQYIDKQSNYIECYTDQNARVFTHYKSFITGEVIDGVANYIILGIRNSSSNFVAITATPTPSVPVNSPTVTRTVTPTPTPSTGSTVTPSPTVTLTPTISITPTITATTSITPTITSSPTRTPTPSPIGFQSFNLSPEFFQGTYPQFPDIIGCVPNNLEIGSLSPGFYNKNSNSYLIESIITTRPIQGGTQYNFQVSMSIASSTPAIDIFSRIRFTDKDGVFRTFTITDSNFITSTSIDSSRGTFIRAWVWTNQPGFLFTAGMTAIILID